MIGHIFDYILGLMTSFLGQTHHCSLLCMTHWKSTNPLYKLVRVDGEHENVFMSNKSSVSKLENRIFVSCRQSFAFLGPRKMVPVGQWQVRDTADMGQFHSLLQSDVKIDQVSPRMRIECLDAQFKVVIRSSKMPMAWLQIRVKRAFWFNGLHMDVARSCRWTRLFRYKIRVEHWWKQNRRLVGS